MPEIPARFPRQSPVARLRAASFRAHRSYQLQGRQHRPLLAASSLSRTTCVVWMTSQCKGEKPLRDEQERGNECVHRSRSWGAFILRRAFFRPQGLGEVHQIQATAEGRCVFYYSMHHHWPHEGYTNNHAEYWNRPSSQQIETATWGRSWSVDLFSMVSSLLIVTIARAKTRRCSAAMMIPRAYIKTPTPVPLITGPYGTTHAGT